MIPVLSSFAGDGLGVAVALFRGEAEGVGLAFDIFAADAVGDAFGFVFDGDAAAFGFGVLFLSGAVQEISGRLGDGLGVGVRVGKDAAVTAPVEAMAMETMWRKILRFIGSECAFAQNRFEINHAFDFVERRH